MPFLTNEEFQLKIKRIEELIKLILQKITDPGAKIIASQVELQAELDKLQAELKAEFDKQQIESDKLKVELGKLKAEFDKPKVELGKLTVELKAELDKQQAELKAELDKQQAELKAELDKQQAELDKLQVPVEANSNRFRELSNSISTFYSNREQNNKISLAIFSIGLTTVFTIAALAIFLPISTPVLTIGIAALSTSIVLIPLTYALIKSAGDWINEKRKTSTGVSSENNETIAPVSSTLRDLSSSVKTPEDVVSAEPPRSDSKIFTSLTTTQPGSATSSLLEP